MNARGAKRIFRIIYRRTRLYLPLLVLFLGMLVFFLPIRAGWLARLAEREISRQLSVEVTIGRVELLLARGSVEARDVRLHPPGGGEPLRVERVALEGTPTGFLAGGGSWPETVTVEGISRQRLERATPGGPYELRGPLADILRARADDLLDELEDDEEEDLLRAAGLPARLPALFLRSLSLSIEAPVPELPDVLLSLDELRVEGRTGSGAPLVFHLRGIASAKGLEQFRLSGTFLPEDERLALRGTLSGIGIPFTVPAVGNFSSRLRDMEIGLVARRTGEAELEGSLEVALGRFEVSRALLGGERWEDDSLSLRSGFRFDTGEGRLTVEQFSLHGDEIDIAIAGELAFREGLPGSARVLVSRLPSAALALGRGELAERLGLQVDEAAADPALTLDFHAEGPFTRPLETSWDAALRVAGWQLGARDIPEPLLVRNVVLRASNELFELDALEVELAGLTARAEGSVPVRAPEDEPEPGTIRVRAAGGADAAFELLSRLGPPPAGLRAWHGPLTAEVNLALHAQRVPDSLEMAWEVDWEQLRAQLGWSEGEVTFERFPEPVTLEPGSLVYEAGSLQIPRAGVSVEGIRLRGDAELTQWRLSEPIELAHLRASLTSTGNVEALVRMAEREVDLPRKWPADARGNYRAELQLDGPLSDPEGMLREGRLRLDEAGGTLMLPHRRFELDDVLVDLVALPEEVQIRRLRARLLDEEIPDSEFELSGLVTAEELRVDLEGRSHLEVLTAILARDLKDVHMRGALPAAGWLALAPRDPLPEGRTVLQRWVALLASPGLRVAPEQDADVILDYDIRNVQETPVDIFPREFPVAIRNIRANATFTPEGIRTEGARADIGSARDVRTDFHITIGSLPSRITFAVDAAALDVNEWMEGWGEQEWSAPPYVFARRSATRPEGEPPRQLADIRGVIRAEEVRFLQFTSGETEAHMRVDVTAGQPTLLWLEPVRTDLYGGEGEATVAMEFASGAAPRIDLTSRFEDADVKGFMDHLLEREQQMDGLITGTLDFSATLLDYPTYEALGTYEITRSSIVGNIILTYARNVLNITSTTGGRDTTIRGTARAENERVHLPDLILINPAVNMTADGYVDFAGRLNFDITASVLSQRLRNIPVVSLVGELINFVGNEIVTYRLRGTVESPEYYPIPTVFSRLERIRDLIRDTGTDAPTSPSPEGN